MEHLEKLIPLAVLLGVAAFLVVLLRRAMRENTIIEPPQEIAVKPAPAVVVAPDEEIASEAAPPKIEAALPTPAPVGITAAGPPPLKSPQRGKPKPVIPPVPSKTPIHGVLDLLRDKNALATAFLLREILGPPVSRRNVRSEPPA